MFIHGAAAMDSPYSQKLRFLPTATRKTDEQWRFNMEIELGDELIPYVDGTISRPKPINRSLNKDTPAQQAEYLAAYKL